jgi:integrase
MRNGKKTPHPGIRRDGRNHYRVRVTMRDPKTGRQREKEQRVQGTIADAVRVREELRDDLRAASLKGPGAHVVKRPPTSETLSDYAKRWLVHLHRTGRNRRHVIEGKVSILERFILPHLGDYDVHDVGRADLGAWIEWLGTLRTNEQPYAKETLAGAWRVVRTMFRDALMLADLERDPTEGVRFRVKGAEPKAKAVLTQDELVRVLAGTDHESPDIRAMIWVGFTTGMRFGELSALLWHDVDQEHGLIHVRRSQVKGNVGPTKTNSTRSVPLHSVVAA